MTTTYTFQPFRGALHKLESGKSVLRQERVDRARAAAEKYFGWLSHHLHLVNPSTLNPQPSTEKYFECLSRHLHLVSLLVRGTKAVPCVSVGTVGLLVSKCRPETGSRARLRSGADFALSR
jgi:hypothetical protein